MKKCYLWLLALLCLLVLLPATAAASEPDAIPIDESHFPDANFRAYVAANMDADQSGFLSRDEISAAEVIQVSEMQLESLDGIQYFTNLKELSCSTNKLTYLDLNHFPELEVLDCSYNNIISLDFSNCPKLVRLLCISTKVLELDLSNCPNLEFLNCGKTAIAELDMTCCPKLTSLYCYDTDLNHLDLSSCPELTTLNCSSAALTSLDCSKCPKLTQVYADKNERFITIDENGQFDLSNLPGFDVNKTSEWYRGTVEGSILTVGNMDSLIGVQYTYDCGNDLLFTFLLKFRFGDMEINPEHFPDGNFRRYICQNLDTDHSGGLSQQECFSVRQLDISGLSIQSLAGIGHFPYLVKLYCSNNCLTSLANVSLPNMYYLDCSSNRLAALDTISLPNLEYLNCSSNPLVTMDHAQYPALETLICENVGLTSLNLIENPVLKSLNCNYNQLETLDLSVCPTLTSLKCGMNRITSINLTGCSALNTLFCMHNQLTELNLQDCTSLESLLCWGNPLTSLDVSSASSYIEVMVYGEGWDYTYPITLQNCCRFDLSTLPGNFDVGKTSSWKNGSVEGSILTVDSGCTEVSYTYDCGQNIKISFCLTFDPEASSHAWGEWTVTKRPDAFSEGEQIHTCSSCGDTETETIPNNPFTDVTGGNKFKPAVLWAYYNGITTGKTDTTFGASEEVTRGQFIMFLWRAAGKPEPQAAESIFSDVTVNNKFFKAIMWGVEQGIVFGKKDGTFGLNDPCTRGHVVLFLYRYAGKPACETSKPAFPDVTVNNKTYYPAVMWAVETGVTSGQSDGTFGLDNTCQRVHAVTFLYRYETAK